MRNRRLQSPHREVLAIKGLLILALLTAGWPALAETGTPGLAAAEDPGEAEVRAGNTLASFSDQDLTALAAQWDDLDVHQRRALLTEVKLRMARSGRQTSGVIHIRTERRYGRIIQQPDGSVLRIETQVVQVRQLPEEAPASGQAAYGVGFERRLVTPDTQPGPRDGLDATTVSGSAGDRAGIVDGAAEQTANPAVRPSP